MFKTGDILYFTGEWKSERHKAVMQGDAGRLVQVDDIHSVAPLRTTYYCTTPGYLGSSRLVVSPTPDKYRHATEDEKLKFELLILAKVIE